MVLVAELHRLFDELIRAGDEIGALQREDGPAETEHQENDRDQAGFRPGVCDFWEYLRHVPCGSAFPGERAPSSAVSGRCPNVHFTRMTRPIFPCEKFLKLNCSGNRRSKTRPAFRGATAMQNHASRIVSRPRGLRLTSRLPMS